MNSKKTEPLSSLDVKMSLIRSKNYPLAKADAIEIAKKLDSDTKKVISARKAEGIAQASLEDAAKQHVKDVLSSTKFYHETKLDQPKERSQVQIVKPEDSREMMRKTTDNF